MPSRSGCPIPWGNLPLVLVVLVVGAATFCTLGLAVAGLVPNASSAPAVVNAIILPVLFISNTFIRIEDGILVTVGDLFPVRPFAEIAPGALESGRGHVRAVRPGVRRGLGRGRPGGRHPDVHLGAARLTPADAR